MADLSVGGRDRGQLLLVAGFAIAVAIVALVLLLNTSIYMENLATRGVDTREGAALEYRNTVEQNLWPVIEAENDREYASRSTLRGNVSDRIDQFAMLSARRHLDNAATTAVSNRTLHNGTWIRQTNESRQMTDASGSANWTMATGVEGVREFDVNTTGGLEATNDTSEAFRIDVVGNDGAGDRWSIYVYENLLGDTKVGVKNGTGSVDGNVCNTLLSGPPELNLTAGTINGTDCPAIEFAKGASPPYEIAITYGNRSTGTYNATANGTAEATNFNGPGPADSPYRVPVVYSASVDVEYRSSTVTYWARVHLPEGST